MGGIDRLQLAVQAEARVVATGSPQDQEHLRSLEATPVVYGVGLRARIDAAAPDDISVAFDCAGEESLDLSIDLVSDRQRIATLNDYRRYKVLGLQWTVGNRNGMRLAALMQTAVTGAFRNPVQRTYGLDEIEAAHRDVETGHGRGKIVVLVGAASTAWSPSESIR